MNQLMSQFPLSHSSYHIHLAIQTGLFSVLQSCHAHSHFMASQVLFAWPRTLSCPQISSIPPDSAQLHLHFPDLFLHLTSEKPQLTLSLSYTLLNMLHSLVKPMTVEKSYQVFFYVRLKPPLGWVPILSQVIVKSPRTFLV